MHEFWRRVVFAFRCFFSILLHGTIPPDIVRELAKSANQTGTPAVLGPVIVKSQPPVPAKVTPIEKPPSDSYDRAVQMLALLQRDGRLIDFLTEDVSPYPDDQLGAAVRNIHDTCRQVIERYVKIEPITDSAEDQPFTVQPGFDPASIKIIGNVKGEPPLRGVLRHRGWRVKEVTLPSLPQGPGAMVIAPAEVEVA